METVRRRAIGEALYPTAGLLNHACRPNTHLVHSGAALTLRAATALAAGEEADDVAALRRELAGLRQENANMFKLQEENAELRTELGTLRLRVQCLEHESGGAD